MFLQARYYGGQKERDIQDTVHTAIMMAILSGLFLVLLGETASRSDAYPYGNTG